MKPIGNKKFVEDKEYRTKLYENNKELYKKARVDFIYGISSNFRQRIKNSKHELEQLEEEFEEYEEVK